MSAAGGAPAPARGAEILVLRDPAAAAADRIVSTAEAGGHIALAGGSTPEAAYGHAAASGALWSEATLWFGDERCVPPEDERSNFAMVRRALLERLEEDPPTVHRMRGELGPEAGAADYERRLQAAFAGPGMPELDLVLLGLGPDGHCASLFPGHRSLDVRDDPVTGVEEAGLEPFVARVTLTLPVINAAREVVFLATGEGKAEAAVRAFAGPPDPATPASLVSPPVGALVVMLDKAAASRLPDPRRRPGR